MDISPLSETKGQTKISNFYSKKSSFYLTPIQRKYLKKPGMTKYDSKVTKRKLQLKCKKKLNHKKANFKKHCETINTKKNCLGWKPLKENTKYDKYKNLVIPRLSGNEIMRDHITTPTVKADIGPIDNGQKENFDGNNLLCTPIKSKESSIGSVYSMFTPSPKRSPMLKKDPNNMKQFERKSLDTLSDNPNVPGTTKVRNLKLHLEARSTPQLIIDAGQKKFGPTQCGICGMLYSANHLHDEEQHVHFHTRFLNCLKYNGWKNERTVAVFSDGKIVKILPNDPSYAMKKVKDVLEVVDMDLGFDNITKSSLYVTFLYINNQKQIIGCLVAEPLTKAQLLQVNNDDSNIWISSSMSYPCICGVSRIWTCAKYRRQKIATKLLDTMRSNFVLGSPVSMQHVALSDPTPAGHKFAVRYFKSQTFLVYNFKK